MVGDIPNNDISDKKKHKKHKKERKERTEIVPPQTLLQLQKTPAFAPNELLTEMGFDVSPNTSISSHSTTSPTTTTVMDEKKYDLNPCLFHNYNLELFQAEYNAE